MPKAAKEKTTSPAKKAPSKRGASPYNMFMKTELTKVKADTPGIGHKEAFKVAASHWKDAPENPKNQAGAAPAASTK